jgi:DNA-binding IclR family transcriptional regulator
MEAEDQRQARRSMVSSVPARPRSVTSRALAVLGTFDASHTRRTLTEISEAAGLPLSTTHRLIAELVAWEGLNRGADGRYEIGRRIWDLGALAAVSRELRETALPFMQDLSSTTGENVHIAVLEGTTALYVDRISGPRAVPVVSRPGARLPLHATGVGKVLLAYGNPDLQRQCLANLTRITRHTVVEPRRLMRQLAEIRSRGYATTSEEMTIGASSIAAPVRDGNNQVIAALGLVTSSHHRGLNRLAPAVQLAARGISRTARSST